jgi:hypothetical protein
MRRGVKNCRIFSNVSILFSNVSVLFSNVSIQFSNVFERFLQKLARLVRRSLGEGGLVLPHFTHLPYFNKNGELVEPVFTSKIKVI